MIPDATYNGLPLTSSAWKCHLDFLSLLARSEVPNLMSFDLHQHQAWVAIFQSGLAKTSESKSSDFRWSKHSLTPRGVAYLEALRDTK